MPELPEVETVMRGIEPALKGKVIKTAVKNRDTLRFPIPDDFSARLDGHKILSFYRRSKYILMQVEGNLTVLIHLGMSGRIRLYTGTEAETYTPEKHDHIVITMSDGLIMAYNDPRRFGMWLFMDSDTIDNHDLIKNIGPEPLGNEFNVDHLKSVFSGKKTPIKTALLDQRLIAGLGNIYVCEVLWKVGVHPTTKAGDISDDKLDAMVPAIRSTLNDAIKAGGSTLKDHAQVDGELGYFQHSFKVYGREDEECLIDGCGGTIERITQSGRSTFYCPKCQKI